MHPNIEICEGCDKPIIGTVYSNEGHTLCYECRFPALNLSTISIGDIDFNYGEEDGLTVDLNESTWPHGTYKNSPSEDMVNNPPHYNQAGIECIDAMQAMSEGASVSPHEAYCWQNAFKYLWRWPYKNGVQDLRKAQWYLDRLIKQMEGA